MAFRERLPAPVLLQRDEHHDEHQEAGRSSRSIPRQHRAGRWETIALSLNCSVLDAAPGSEKLAINRICWGTLGETLLIASCKFAADTSPFISHPGNNIPSLNWDILLSFCSTSLAKELVKIKARA